MKMFSLTMTALITPFENGEVHAPSLEKLVKQQLDGGVNGFVVNGTTAESPTLTKKEIEKTFSIVKSITGGSVKIIVGTGSNSTATTIESGSHAEKLGADGVLVVVPYYNKPPQRGLFQHFKAVANSTSLPVMLYNVPGRTVTSLEPKTILELSEIKNIVGIKEASGNIELMKEIKKICPPEFTILSGDDGTYVELLANGGDGVISVATHVIPRQMSQWKSWIAEGKTTEARADYQKYSKLIDLLFCEANPIPVKMALFKMGVISKPELRLPLVALSDAFSEKLVQEMKNVGVI